MAEADPGGARAGRAPQIILSLDRDRDGVDILDWKARFGRRSPLSRKIITFNLLALGVLLTGVLYLTQFQGGLVDLRLRTLATESRMIANVLSDRLQGREVGAAGPRALSAALEDLQAIGAYRILLFDSAGRPVELPDPDGPVQVVDLRRTLNDGGQPPSAFTVIMGEVWDRISRMVAARRAQDGAFYAGDYAPPLARQALETGETAEVFGPTAAGEQVSAVATPIPGVAGPLGALVLSTPPGEMDAVIRAERDKILQVFALAIISSIVLSLVLAGTIVRPLRDLSEAAHRGGTRNARQVNPERINIPDMTGRPDEIGYLSGAMRLMTAALFDRIEQNESFAADVTHEIKNPLTSLRSAVDTMPYARTESDRARLLEVIRNDVDRLDRLVTDISNASRLDRELVRDRMEAFDLHRTLHNLIAFNEEQAAAIGARLVALFPDRPLTVTGLEGRLAQVFVNLITNAISFAAEGDEIRVATHVSAGRVRVTVEDEGPGIPDDNLGDVFARFYSQRPDKEAFGGHSGLGLAISRQIVEAHGGAIWAENVRPAGTGRDTPPEGARFTVELPV